MLGRLIALLRGANLVAGPSRGPGPVVEPTSSQEQTRIARLIGWIAFSLSIIVAIGAPAGYLWLSYRSESRESEIAAKLHAAFLTQVIAQAPSHWQDSVAGLIDTELTVSQLPEQRILSDLGGKELARSGAAFGAPYLSSSITLPGPEGAVGQITVRRSIQPLLWRAAGIGGLSLVLGLVIYLSLRVLPMRALRRTLRALRLEEAKSRQQVEGLLQIVFEQAIDGILMFNQQGQVVSVNPAAIRMFSATPSSLIGRPLMGLFQHATETGPDQLLAPGRFESVAVSEDGRQFPVDVTISETGVSGDFNRIALLRDITERKQNEASLSRMANFDSLTGLPNRHRFRDRLHKAMERCENSSHQMALLFLDLDRFKVINDSLGHDVGDKLLQQVAAVLNSCLRESTDLSLPRNPSDVYRLGGDEFVVLLEHLPEVFHAAHVAQRILKALEQPIQVGEDHLFISASIGITIFPRDFNSLDGLIKQADMAMYEAKAMGKGTFQFFSTELGAEASARLDIEAGLRHAMARGEFSLCYQPKADLATGRVTGVEALLRWNRGDGQQIGPSEFVPILEEIGQIVPVGNWVLREACRQMVAWQQAGMRPISLAVNLSPRQFSQPDLLEQMTTAIRDSGLPPQQLEIEITESTLIHDLHVAMDIMHGMTAMGVSVAIDDFGTGHSSLSYLKRFNVNTLKIDRSFVMDLPHDPEDSAIARTVIALGHGLNLRVVAEGVETQAQADFLRRHGCDAIQGYLLSQPLAPDEFPGWLARQEQGTGQA